MFSSVTFVGTVSVTVAVVLAPTFIEPKLKFVRPLTAWLTVFEVLPVKFESPL